MAARHVRRSEQLRAQLDQAEHGERPMTTPVYRRAYPTLVGTHVRAGEHADARTIGPAAKASGGRALPGPGTTSGGWLDRPWSSLTAHPRATSP